MFNYLSDYLVVADGDATAFHRHLHHFEFIAIRLFMREIHARWKKHEADSLACIQRMARRSNDFRRLRFGRFAACKLLLLLLLSFFLAVVRALNLRHAKARRVRLLRTKLTLSRKFVPRTRTHARAHVLQRWLNK